MLELNLPGKVLALILDNGEVLVDRQFILDYLDGIADAERTLLPPVGAARREVPNLTAIAVGLAEKAVALRWEQHRWRPQSIESDWVERLRRQVNSCLSWFEAPASSTWLNTTQRREYRGRLHVHAAYARADVLRWSVSAVRRPGIYGRAVCRGIVSGAGIERNPVTSMELG
jgi:hypothetical protein